jgi:redox-sensing transcriptional repressor
MISDKAIGRLSIYLRILNELIGHNQQYIYSHDLAVRAGATAAQVRRDIMNVGYSGHPNRGYDVGELAHSIDAFLVPRVSQHVALAGVGNLGRAILTYFGGRHPRLSIDVVFDNDPRKYDRVISGCTCFPVSDMVDVLIERDISIGIITVPSESAQMIADKYVQSGVTGILNFAPIPVHVPTSVYVDNIDMTMSLEKVAYFSQQTYKGRGNV